ncbi:MAG: 5'/3'-nucleotidase SurE [Cyanobacteria bacterium TGS_CYA1]|nr:5'/3'-nucleotidase SurE [Cyanobacteria bacterium TGS_CYA1]
MRILVANDDGIHSPGIQALAQSLATDHEVYVVAPDRERSAAGHSLTLYKPLRVQEVKIDGGVVKAWSTNGTPSDGVKLAVSVLLDHKPDLVISGINRGYNLGTEVLYSGTVAAAMEGVFLGVTSIAVSQDRDGAGQNLEAACSVMKEIVKRVAKLDVPLDLNTLINVNFPNVPLSELRGIAVTELGNRFYNDSFEHRRDPYGQDYYWLMGHAIDHNEKDTSDVVAVSQKKVSVSPVKFNMTDHSFVKQWQNHHIFDTVLGMGAS